MDESNYHQFISDLEAAPGVFAGIVTLLIALFIFSSYARARMKHRFAQLVWAAARVGAVVCGLIYLSTYFV